MAYPRIDTSHIVEITIWDSLNPKTVEHLTDLIWVWNIDRQTLRTEIKSLPSIGTHDTEQYLEDIYEILDMEEENN